MSPHCRLLTLLLVAAATVLAIFLASVILYRKITRKRTVPADLMKPPFPAQGFSYSLLRASIDLFSAANCLIQGGFCSVYRGVLPSGQEIAMKLMSEASIHGDREFQNELSLASRIDAACCPNIVFALGFSTSDAAGGCGFHNFGHRRKRKEKKLALVYRKGGQCFGGDFRSD